MKKHKKIILSLIIIIIIAMLYFTISFFQKKDINNNDKSFFQEEDIISYLNGKYGNHGFKVVYFKKNDNCLDDFIQKEYTSYYWRVSSTSTNSNIDVNSRSYGDNIPDSISENFLQLYYIYNTRIKDGISFLVRIDEKKIPDDYGRVPTITELLELDAVKEQMSLYIENDNGNYTFKEEEDLNVFLNALYKDAVLVLNLPQNIGLRVDIVNPTPNSEYESFNFGNKGLYKIY